MRNDLLNPIQREIWAVLENCPDLDLDELKSQILSKQFNLNNTEDLGDLLFKLILICNKKSIDINLLIFQQISKHKKQHYDTGTF